MEKPEIKLREHCFWYASIYSIACLMVPIGIYSNGNLFKRFCDFHSRKLKLQGKNTAQLFFLAVGVSIIYSSISLNLYYRGLLKIIGLNSLYDIEGVISNEIINKYNLEDIEIDDEKKS